MYHLVRPSGYLFFKIGCSYIVRIVLVQILANFDKMLILLNKYSEGVKTKFLKTETIWLTDYCKFIIQAMAWITNVWTKILLFKLQPEQRQNLIFNESLHVSVYEHLWYRMLHEKMQILQILVKILNYLHVLIFNKICSSLS